MNESYTDIHQNLAIQKTPTETYCGHLINRSFKKNSQINGKNSPKRFGPSFYPTIFAKPPSTRKWATWNPLPASTWRNFPRFGDGGRPTTMAAFKKVKIGRVGVGGETTWVTWGNIEILKDTFCMGHVCFFFFFYVFF